MLRGVLFPLALSVTLLLPLAGSAKPITDLKSFKLDMPIPDQMFPEGPGADAINANCLVCHSEDHVMNQPSLTKEGWTEVVEKMIKAYKAPISEADASAIVDYLVRIKGRK
ncbi:c-type cytochrome [Methyloferula stellata]|uniref:c-type cytochrome n=1 Tax=Methyloferula stellata TaxID=876270 RepID=UPI00035DBBFD|nr:cytochrome c [Methyloferula stellata]